MMERNRENIHTTPRPLGIQGSNLVSQLPGTPTSFSSKTGLLSGSHANLAHTPTANGGARRPLTPRQPSSPSQQPNSQSVFGSLHTVGACPSTPSHVHNIHQAMVSPSPAGSLQYEELVRQVQHLKAELINSQEDARQYQVEYEKIREEGSQLFEAYSSKCARLTDLQQRFFLLFFLAHA